MYCTTCGAYIKDEHSFCTRCGARRPVMPSMKKGTRWIPITITVFMFLLGLLVYSFSLYGWPLN